MLPNTQKLVKVVLEKYRLTFPHMKNGRRRAASFAQNGPLFYYEPVKWHTSKLIKVRQHCESIGLLLLLFFVLIGLFAGIKDVPSF